MSKFRTIYLDHAATSYPKPDAVGRAIRSCMELAGGNPGRGSHHLSLSASKELYRCRELTATMFGTAPERVIFTLNATHALNLAIKGFMKRGGHALCSDLEHNAVLRPLYRLLQDGVIDLDTFSSFPLMEAGRDDAIMSSLATSVRADTRMVVCTHASNICSAHMPIKRIGAFCHRRNIVFVVDASQSAGAADIDMERDHIDALCVPGHKGLLGPQGTGMLLLGKRFSDGYLLDTLMEGGNGVDSLSPLMTDESPERYEAGTPATASIAGLRAGLETVASLQASEIGEREATIAARLRDGLLSLPQVTVYAPSHKGSIVLFSVNGTDSEAISSVLDREGICVRPGFHCSALGHRSLGTPTGGAVRASVGYSTTDREIERFLRAVTHITS